MTSSNSDFHAVILAAPYESSSINFDAPLYSIPRHVDFVQLHVTLFTSPFALSPKHFNLPEGELVPLTILTTLPDGETPLYGPKGVGSPGFFSISTLSTVTNPAKGRQEFLYKIFSADPLSNNWLHDLLGVDQSSEGTLEPVTWIFRKLWASYPYEVPRNTFDEIEIGENIFYTGGMESFISTMETNALMGKNVARLLVDKVIAHRTAFDFSRLEQEDFFRSGT